MIKPMLARDHPSPFNDPNYIWECKYDGARVIARVNGSGYKLQARSGSDKTSLFPELVFKTKTPCILDGELVCYDGGRSSFNLIQRRINRVNHIPWAQDNFPVFYEVFDIIEVENSGTEINLRHIPLKDRKEILNGVLSFSANVRVAPYVDGDGNHLFTLAKEKGWEGIIGKNLKSHYLEGKREWLKIKVWQEGTFLVVGYTKGTGWRVSTFGALVLSDLKGNYVGAVGTGFDEGMITHLCELFMPASCPFPREPEPATWIKPFSIRVKFLEYTNSGILRFPSFKGVK